MEVEVSVGFRFLRGGLGTEDHLKARFDAGNDRPSLANLRIRKDAL